MQPDLNNCEISSGPNGKVLRDKHGWWDGRLIEDCPSCKSQKFVWTLRTVPPVVLPIKDSTEIERPKVRTCKVKDCNTPTNRTPQYCDAHISKAIEEQKDIR